MPFKQVYYILFGFDPQKPLPSQEEWLAKLHPNDRNMLLGILEKLNDATYQGESHEIRYLRADESYGTLLQRCFVLRDENQNAIRLMGSFLDISERKKMETLLLETSNVARVGGWEFDIMNYKIIWSATNKAIHEVADDYEPDLYHAMQFYKAGNNRIKIAKAIQAAIEEGIPYDLELEMITAKGNEIWVRDIGRIEIIEGKPIRLYGMIQDITQKKQEEQRLKLLESVITNIEDGVLITESEPFEEPGPKIVFVNKAFTKMTGYTSEEVIGKSPRFLQGAKTDRSPLDELKTDIKKWNSSEIEVVNYKKNGEEFWVNFTIVPVADEHGRFTHWVSIQRDITIRKRAEEEEILFNQIKDILFKNRQFKNALQEILQKICDYLGIVYSEFWSLNFSESKMVYRINCSSEKNDISLESILEVEEGLGLPGMVLSDKKIIYWNDLQKSPFIRKQSARKNGLKSAMGVPIFLNNKIIAILSLFSNTTMNSRQLESDLLNRLSKELGTYIQKKRLEDELNLFFEISTDLFCIASTDGYFKKINPAFTQVLGYSEKELLSQPFVNFIHVDDLHITGLSLQALAEGTPLHNFENRFMDKEGKVKWLAWTATSLISEDLIFAVAEDITVKHQMEEEKTKLIEELTKNNKELKQFSYITSHNLRAPLTNLVALSDLLDTSTIQDEFTLEIIKGFKISTKNLNDTLTDLIKILIIKENTSKELQELSLEKFFKKVITSIESIIFDAKASILVDFSVFDSVLFSPIYIESIFLNLITNAIKYAHPDRKPIIKIYTHIENQNLQLIFEDNGLGFDMERVKNKVFGLYQRFHNRPDSKGIGLYLVHSQITALGGNIALESTKNEGSRFIITFKPNH